MERQLQAIFQMERFRIFPTRVGYRYAEDGKKIRFCKKCNETL
mgnify:CR=1 FL=1